jgi:hypothetical protein
MKIEIPTERRAQNSKVKAIVQDQEELSKEFDAISLNETPPPSYRHFANQESFLTSKTVKSTSQQAKEDIIFERQRKERLAALKQKTLDRVKAKQIEEEERKRLVSFSASANDANRR